MEPFEASGQWWLPENPDHKVAGTLSVSDTGRSDLRLIGSLRSPLGVGETSAEGDVTQTVFTDKSMHAAGVFSRIAGLSGSKAFTLDDCFQTHWSGDLFGRGLDAQTIHVNQVLRGAYFEPGEALEFTTLIVRMDWLVYWVLLGGITESVTVQNPDDTNASMKPIEHVLTIKPVDPLDLEGPGGAAIQLAQMYGLDGDHITERRLTQDFYFVVGFPDVVPLQDLLSQAGALQDLVSIGTGKVAAFKEVSLRHPDIERSFGDKTHELPIELFAQWQVKNSQHPEYLTSYDMPFTFAQLGGAGGTEKWLKAVEQHRPALSRVMSTRYSPNRYVGDSFINCAAALEGYDRTKHGCPPIGGSTCRWIGCHFLSFFRLIRYLMNFELPARLVPRHAQRGSLPPR